MFRLYSQSGRMFECHLKYAQAKSNRGCTPWFFPSNGNSSKQNSLLKSNEFLIHSKNVWPMGSTDIPLHDDRKPTLYTLLFWLWEYNIYNPCHYNTTLKVGIELGIQIWHNYITYDVTFKDLKTNLIVKVARPKTRQCK